MNRTTRLERAAWVALALIGAGLLARGLWIPAKAALAQALLERAWETSQRDGRGARPWPWADSWPVARLRVPAHGVDLVVLAGATGRTLAFAPGHLAGSAGVGASGNTVLSGHRDTHFRFLAALRSGDEIELEGLTGATHRYRVTRLEIVDEHAVSVLAESDRALLTLVTCYPFETPLPGGPLRYVVVAEEAAAAGVEWSDGRAS
jgi:sortase A